MSFPMRFVIIIGLLVLAAGCTPTPAPAPAAVSPTTAPAAADPADALTPLPPTPTPEADEPQPAFTATPAPIERQPLAATVNVDSLNLRSGPGTLFEVLSTLPLGSMVTALGIAPGNDWVEIEDENGQTGWVYAELLTLDGDLATLPLLEAPQSLSINGKVIDQNGQTINGVQVQVTAQLFDFAVQFVTRSNADGYFYTFFRRTRLACGWWRSSAQIVTAVSWMATAMWWNTSSTTGQPMCSFLQPLRWFLCMNPQAATSTAQCRTPVEQPKPMCASLPPAVTAPPRRRCPATPAVLCCPPPPASGKYIPYSSILIWKESACALTSPQIPTRRRSLFWHPLRKKKLPLKNNCARHATYSQPLYLCF